MAVKIPKDVLQSLEKQGADLTDPDLRDSTILGCMIYCEPGTARMQVEQYIKDKL